MHGHVASMKRGIAERVVPTVDLTVDTLCSAMPVMGADGRRFGAVHDGS